MTNSEQAIREFADGIMKSHETWGKPWNAEMREEGIEEIMEITTALISEHYYPKEKYDELLQQRDELKDKYSRLLEATSEFLKSMKTDNAELKKSIAEMSEDMASEAAAIKNTER